MEYTQIEKIKDAKKICLISHLEPDADALCSMIVFKNFLLAKFNAKVDIFAEFEHLPHSYDCLTENQNLNPEPDDYDFAVMLDAPKSERLGKYESLFKNCINQLVVDHHSTNEFDKRQNIVEVVSSTCEIVYKILKENDYNFSKADFGMIYAGIITDTNNLTVGALNQHTFEIVGDCVQNVEFYPIYENFMLNNTLQNMQILANVILNCKCYNQNKILISHFSKEQAEAINATQDSYIGIINRLSTINGARLIAFIYPKGDEYYVSMRGRAGANVGNIAKQNGGGGHDGAAAYMSTQKLEDIEKYLLKEFENVLSKTDTKLTKLF